MLQNTKMAVESIGTKNDNSLLIKVERMYAEQRQLQTKLLEINSIMVGSDIMNTPELDADCVMAYLDETESMLNSSLDMASSILQIMR